MAIAADLSGCRVVFVVATGNMVASSRFIHALKELEMSGVPHVRTLNGIDEATAELVKIQRRHNGIIPNSEMFLRVTQRGDIVQLFR